MAPRHGYLLPTNINPPDDVCMLLFVPNDQNYIRAVLGQYQELAQWFRWERDELKQGTLAAQRMRRSILDTLELWEDMGDMCPLEINVNCNGSASDCCSQLIQFDVDVEVHVPVSVITEINLLPGGQVDNGFQPPSEDWATYDDYVTVKCSYANQLATDIYNTWENLGTLGFTAAYLSFSALAALVSSGALASSIVGLLAVGISTAGLMTAVGGAFLLLGVVFGSAFYQYFENLQDQITIEDLRCAMYGATDAQDAQDRLESQFRTWGIAAGIDVFGGTEFLEYMVLLAKALMPLNVLEPLFDNTDYATTLPIADCSMCTGVEPPPWANLDRGAWTLTHGFLPETSEPLTFYSELVSNCERIEIWLNSADGATFIDATTATVTDIRMVESVPLNCGSAHFFRFYDQAGNVIASWSSTSSPVFPINDVARIHLAGEPSQGQFIAEIDWTF